MKQNKFYIDERGFLRHAQTGLAVNTQQAVDGCEGFEEGVLACIQDTVRQRMTAEAPSGHGLVEEAVGVGSMLPAIAAAQQQQYAVIVVQPPCPSQAEAF